MHENPARDNPTMPTPEQPAEGRPEMEFPGADEPDQQADRNDDLPERLGERIDRQPDGIAAGDTDLLPNVEVPDAQM